MTLYRLFFVGFLGLSNLATCQPQVNGSYIHFRSVEKNNSKSLLSGSGGIIELYNEEVNFIRDSIKATGRRTRDKIWFSDSVSAQVIYEYPDSLRLLLNNSYIDYRALKKFSGNKNLLQEIDNYTWDFISENFSFTLIPESKKSYVRYGASIYSRIDFPMSNDVWDFHLKINSHAESVTFTGFDLHYGFSTIQMIDENQDTIKCELFQDGMLVNGQLIKRTRANEAEVLSIKTKLMSKKWLATWNYQQKVPGEIQLINEGSSYIDGRNIKNGQVSFSFYSDGRYHFNNGKHTEAGSWKLSADGNYVLLKNDKIGKSSIRLTTDSTKNMSLIDIQHIKYKQEFLYGEKVVFK